jgi:hypothetical protein
VYQGVSILWRVDWQGDSGPSSNISTIMYFSYEYYLNKRKEECVRVAVKVNTDTLLRRTAVGDISDQTAILLGVLERAPIQR